MLRLHLFRHAEAIRPPDLADFDRPLSARGRIDAEATGRRLAELALAPRQVVVSPARRTRETWDLASPSLGGATIREEPALYDASAQTLLGVVRGLGLAGEAMLVGHNPGLGDLARLLVAASDRAGAAQLRAGLATSAVAILVCPRERWRDAAPAAFRLEHLLVPPSADGKAG